MIMLGIYKTINGNKFDCHFIENEKIAQAVGPLPSRIRAKGVAFQIDANTEE